MSEDRRPVTFEDEFMEAETSELSLSLDLVVASLGRRALCMDNDAMLAVTVSDSTRSLNKILPSIEVAAASTAEQETKDLQNIKDAINYTLIIVFFDAMRVTRT